MEKTLKNQDDEAAQQRALLNAHYAHFGGGSTGWECAVIVIALAVLVMIVARNS